MSLGFSASNEGGKTETSGTIRTLRKKSDVTSIKLEFKPNTKT